MFWYFLKGMEPHSNITMDVFVASDQRNCVWACDSNQPTPAGLIPTQPISEVHLTIASTLAANLNAKLQNNQP